MNETPMPIPGVSRRRFLAGAATAGVAAAAGCVTNPVTGKSQFSLIAPDDEIRLDKEQSPHQFSSDYGALRLPEVQAYVDEVGRGLVDVSHRPAMPYSFRVVHASYVNAYAFPGGSIAATRGILLTMENESQLAALLGHEIGHVCARHTARRMTNAMLAQLVIVGASVALDAKKHEQTAAIVAGLGGVAAGALLAHYSRDDERQADALGMEYMVKAGHNPQGMVDLMDVLVRQEKRRPSALETMFSTHPMSRERRDTAAERARTAWAAGAGLPVQRERFMDRTEPVRAMANAVAAIQQGDEALNKRKLAEAEAAYRRALTAGPDDYEALLKIAACMLAMNRPRDARQWAERARAVYPEEPMALQILGVAALTGRQFDLAHQCFAEYGRRLPGNPATLFHDALALDAMGRRKEASERYLAFLQASSSGDEADHARARLLEWGVLKPTP